MIPRITGWPLRLGVFRMLFSEARLAFRLIREPRVPSLTKALPLLAFLYLISPFDLVPDVLPFLGQLDDLGFVLAMLQVFRRVCPAATVTFHRGAIVEGRQYAPMPAAADVIDAKWRRV
jgi:uncharacterized membrane protein YkvA (DUF1232 family)